MKLGQVIIGIILILVNLEKVLAQGNERHIEYEDLIVNKPQLLNRFKLNKVILSKTTVFTPEEVGQIVYEYVNQEISLFDLRAIQELLTQAYVDAGYVNSIVLLESQKIIEGVIYYSNQE